MFSTFGREIRLIGGLLAFLGLLVIGMHLSLGGGDIKLITSLVLFADINFGLIEYLEMSMVTGSAHLLIDYARKGRVSGNIALAPTICLPLLFSLASG